MENCLSALWEKSFKYHFRVYFWLMPITAATTDIFLSPCSISNIKANHRLCRAMSFGYRRTAEHKKKHFILFKVDYMKWLNLMDFSLGPNTCIFKWDFVTLLTINVKNIALNEWTKIVSKHWNHLICKKTLNTWKFPIC